MSFSLRHFREGLLPSRRDRHATASARPRRLHDRALSRSGRARACRARTRARWARESLHGARLSTAPRIGHLCQCPAQAVSEGAPRGGFVGAARAGAGGGRLVALGIACCVGRRGSRGKLARARARFPLASEREGPRLQMEAWSLEHRGRDFCVIVKDRAVTLPRERRPSCRGCRRSPDSRSGPRSRGGEARGRHRAPRRSQSRRVFGRGRRRRSHPGCGSR